MTPLEKLARASEQGGEVFACLSDEIMAVLASAHQLREFWTGKSDLFLALAALEKRIEEVMP